MFSRTIFADGQTEKAATHQRICRAARHEVTKYLPAGKFLPSSKQIVHFEGHNGPDGLAGKHSTGDFPTEFIDPADPNPPLYDEILNRIHNLRRAAKQHNEVRMAFEMAWLEHVVVDGLTPAHHQPFKKQLKELDPRSEAEINSILKRILVPSKNPLDLVLKNLRKSGPRGIATHHILFEAGIDFIVMPTSPKKLAPTIEISVRDLALAKSGKYPALYRQSVDHINQHQMFQRYETAGWTSDLVEDVRKVLLPEAVRMVILAWLAGLC
jgi:hypothetical protein